MNQADDLPRKNDGQQGIGDPLHRNIAERQQQNSQIGNQIDPLDRPAENMMETHSQRVISRSGTAGANTKAGTHTDEKGENEIVMVLQQGYKLGDTVIRPAMVQVAN